MATVATTPKAPIGPKLRTAIELRKVTKKDAAKQIGVSVPTLYDYLNGKTEPKGAMAGKVNRWLSKAPSGNESAKQVVASLSVVDGKVTDKVRQPVVDSYAKHKGETVLMLMHPATGTITLETEDGGVPKTAVDQLLAAGLSVLLRRREE